MVKFLHKQLDKYRDYFEAGGRLERFYPIFEATDTILFSTNEVTKSGPHIRDSIDTKRVMILVVISLLPLYMFGAINVGYQNTIASMVERTLFGNLLYLSGLILCSYDSHNSTGKCEHHANCNHCPSGYCPNNSAYNKKNSRLL